MKKCRFLLYALGIILTLGSCKKDNPIKDIEEDPIAVKEDSVFVIGTRKSAFFGTDVLHTSATLDRGILITEGTGVEQDGSSRNYIVNGNRFFSLLFAQSNPGDVVTYTINGQAELIRGNKLQTETMTAYGNVGKDILLFKNAWQPAENTTYWYRIDATKQEIVAEGTIDATALLNNGEKAFFTDVKKVGEKVFVSFWSVQSGLNFRTANPDESYIAVYAYPSMALEKVLKDNRTGGIGALYMSGLEVDEQGDLYVLNTKMNWDIGGKYSTKTPVAFTRVKKGSTELDKSYFVNLSALSDNHYVWRKQYLGKGYFLLSVCPNAYAYATMFYSSITGGGLKFAVVNVYDGSFKWVTGMPTSALSTTADYGHSDLDGSGYIGVYYSEGDAEKSTVFKVDGATATAKVGLSTDGKAAITAIFKVPVTK